MKKWRIAFAIGIFPIHAAFAGALGEKVWNHGSEDCASNHDPAIEVFQFDASTYILRQNKCIHFEAPFIYVLFGEHTVFVQDTGATADPGRFPLYEVVQGLVAQRNKLPSTEQLKILVTHSHSHRDHRAADAQFRGQPGVVRAKFVVTPLGAFWRVLGGVLNWMGFR